jgi:hypothetical protein
MTSQLDEERPIGGSVAQGDDHGKITGDAGPAPFHVVVHHYCYPTVGVETNLGDLPVLECNRWEPVFESDLRELAQRRHVFMESERGQTYKRELAEWHEARAAEEALATEAAGPFISAVVVTVDGREYEIAVDGDPMTIRQLRQRAYDSAYWPPSPPAPAPLDAYQLLDAVGNAITNLDSTLNELGITDGERFILQRPQGA